jgi:hypothetical protein
VAALTVGIGAIVGGYAARARTATRADDAPPITPVDEDERPQREFVWGRSGR